MRITKKIWKRGLGLGLSFAMAASLIPSVPLLGAELSETAKRKPTDTKACSVPVSEGTVTLDNPFKQWTAGNQYFRIPSLITLQDGTLLGTCDARWGTFLDGGGLDSIASISKDGGRTWNYSFPLYFPDSNGVAGWDAWGGYSNATTIIDPGIVEGPDGTVYFMVDVNPTGSTTMYKKIGTGTGYVTVDNGKDRGRYLALSKEYRDVCWDTEPTDDDTETYPYYIADFDEDGYAMLRKRTDGEDIGYAVDGWYNLYTVRDGEIINDLTQDKVDEPGTKVQQNVFYENSLYNVYSIGYIWLIASKDGGQTWEAPRDITDQVKRHTDENAILVSPGQGITTSSGDIVLGFYNSMDDEENASMVYSTDNGATWKRTADVAGADAGGFASSENEIVELSDGTLRMFLRTKQSTICYADAVKNEKGEYVFSKPVKTEISALTDGKGCNLSAITYSKKIDGKQVILLATPTGPSRARGKIYSFLAEEDNSLTLLNIFTIPGAESGFCYSCLTEMKDGRLALLWEPNKWETTQESMRFSTYNITDLIPEAHVEGAFATIELAKGETYTKTYSVTSSGESGITDDPDEAVASAETVLEDGKTKLTITGNGIGYTEAVIDNMTYKIRVKDNAHFFTSDDESYTIEDVMEVPEIDADGAVSMTVQDTGVRLHDNTAEANNSLNGFSNTPNSAISLSDAEFKFTASGSKWQIFNVTKNRYLNGRFAVTFFDETANDMAVEAHGDGLFRISNPGLGKWIIFNLERMQFDVSGNPVNATNTAWQYDFTLLEKQNAQSDDDILPGYKKATGITSGKSYLITYNYQGNIIMLYPENGQDNDTKLVKTTSRLIIAPKKTGEASITVDGAVYNFKVCDPGCTHATTEVKGAVPADCMEDGYTGDTYCANSNCGKLLSEGEAVPSLGHDWGEGETTKQVTDEEDGEISHICQNNPAHIKTVVVSALAFAPLKEEYDQVSDILENFREMYEADTIKELEKVCEASQTVMESGTSLQLTASAAVLKSALKTIQLKPATEIKKELGKSRAEAKEDYQEGGEGIDPAIWKAFEDAYQAIDLEEDAIVETMLEWQGKLAKARKALVAAKLDKSQKDLAAGVEAAEKFYSAGEATYTSATWTPFQNAYEAAMNPPEKADSKILTKLLEDLAKAQARLKTRATDEETRGLKESYTAASADYKAGGAGIASAVWNAFKNAYEAIDLEEDLSAEDARAWKKELERTHRVLVSVKTENAEKSKNEGALKAGVSKAKSFYDAGASKYTKETWDKFSKAYLAALKPPANADAKTLARLLSDLTIAQNALIPVKEGYRETVGSIEYEITSLKNKTVKVTGGTAASVKIPASVKIKEESYKVTEIAAKAFMNSKKVGTVVIGGNVTTIGSQSFYGCKKLTKVTIGAKVKTIGGKSFQNCQKLSKVTFKGTAVKKVQSGAFKKTSSKMKAAFPKKMSGKARNGLKKKLKKAGMKIS